MKPKLKQQNQSQHNLEQIQEQCIVESSGKIIDQQVNHLYLSPQKRSSHKIFVQTPQPLFIPISQKNEEFLHSFQKNLSRNLTQKMPDKNIFQQNSSQKIKQKSQISSFQIKGSETTKNVSSNVIKSKASISLKKQVILEFFYYQNFIVCKGIRKVIVYNLFTKSLAHIPINEDEFILTPFAPYIFNCIVGQFFNLYTQNAVQKYMQIQRKRESQIRKDFKTKNNTFSDIQAKSQIQPFRQNLEVEKSPKFSAIQVVTIKISKLQVQCICKHSQSYFLGGYNRSILPGGQRSQRRQIYEMDHLDPKINNKPKNIIKIEPNSFPVSIINVQMPYLIVYCKPKFYLFGLKTYDLLLTFTKELNSFFLLEGRYAFNVINGMGVCIKNNKQMIFTFDLESSPVYGVEITEHKQQASSLCLQKTGRIFGSSKSALFEYIPHKRITRCVKLYPEGEHIVWIQSTPSNNLLVLRKTQKLEYVIEAFTIDENTITDF